MAYKHSSGTSHTERAMLDAKPTTRGPDHALSASGPKLTDGQRRQAQLKLAAFAVERDDPEAFLREMLGMLGLAVRLP